MRFIRVVGALGFLIYAPPSIQATEGCDKQPSGTCVQGPKDSNPKFRIRIIQRTVTNTGPSSSSKGGTGGGGRMSSVMQQRILCAREQHSESESDELAQEVAEAIQQEWASSENNRTGVPETTDPEYGSFVIKLANDTIVRSPVVPGRTGSVRLDEIWEFASIKYPGISGSNIIGIVHSHPPSGRYDYTNGPPRVGTLNDIDFGNTLPSSPNLIVGSRNDWESTERFLRAKGLTDTAELAHYIIGPDGVLREYDYIKGDPTIQTDMTETIENGEKDAKGECSR